MKKLLVGAVDCVPQLAMIIGLFCGLHDAPTVRQVLG